MATAVTAWPEARPWPLPPELADPLDVAQPALWAEHRWQAPMAELRRQGGVHWCEDGRFGPYWSITTYKPIVHIEALPKVFSSEGGITLVNEPPWLKPEEVVAMPMFIAMDPPKHTAQRRTVAPLFGPSEVGRMRAACAAQTAEVLDALPLGETFDWVERVSIELTTGMLARLFDFPWEERANLTRWSDALGDVEFVQKEADRQRRLVQAYEMASAFGALWQRKAAGEPGPDLISAMLHSDAMAAMDQGEFMGNLILLIVGGNDTTRNSMTAYAYGLGRYPDERAKLEADPALIPNAVQELVRWQTPLAHMRRTALEDAEVEGQRIRAGDKLALWYASANRDESVFEDGEAIRVDRPNARRHLSFGYGIHRCVGARVAELQLTVLMEEMARRRLRVQPVGEPTRVPACFVNGYRALPVRLERR